MGRCLQTLALAASLSAAAAAQEPAPPVEPRSEEPEGRAAAGRRVIVVELAYADAFELAELLSQIMPPSVRIVPYGPTNSLVISGDPELIGTAAPDER